MCPFQFLLLNGCLLPVFKEEYSISKQQGEKHKYIDHFVLSRIADSPYSYAFKSKTSIADCANQHLGACLPDDEVFWSDTKPNEILGSRNRQIESRSAFLAVAGRGNVDLTASGTKLLAFVSKTPIAPTWAFWSLRVSSFEDACLTDFF